MTYSIGKNIPTTIGNNPKQIEEIYFKTMAKIRQEFYNSNYRIHDEKGDGILFSSYRRTKERSGQTGCSPKNKNETQFTKALFNAKALIISSQESIRLIAYEAPLLRRKKQERKNRCDLIGISKSNKGFDLNAIEVKIKPSGSTSIAYGLFQSAIYGSILFDVFNEAVEQKTSKLRLEKQALKSYSEYHNNKGVLAEQINITSISFALAIDSNYFAGKNPRQRKTQIQRLNNVEDFVRKVIKPLGLRFHGYLIIGYDEIRVKNVPELNRCFPSLSNLKIIKVERADELERQLAKN